MSEMLTPLPFITRRAPSVQKIIDDGERMYGHARYVIVLNAQGEVLESFENPPFGGTVDCLVVLVPYTYRHTLIAKTVVLEIGFRRFVPYSHAEYRLEGSTKRGPRIRYKKGDVKPKTKEKFVFLGKVYAIKPRVLVVKLSEETLLRILPAITHGIQYCVDEIIRTWTDTEVIQSRYPKRNHTYTYTASISVRIPETTLLLCAAARFAEIRYRISEGKNLAANAKMIRTKCARFIRARRKAVETKKIRKYPDSEVTASWLAWSVADYLRQQIRDHGYSKQMVDEILEMIGPANSPERILLNQIWRVYKIPRPIIDRSFAKLELKYGAMKNKLLKLWGIETFSSPRHDRKRLKHGCNTLTMRVSGSRKELEAIMERLLQKRIGALADQERRETKKETADDDIPF